MSGHDVIDTTASEEPWGPDERAPAPAIVPATVTHQDVAAQAVSAAARQALAEPGSAGRDEFLTMCLKARMWSMSGLAPKAVQGKPYDALVILQTGRGLGLDEAAAMQTVHVIDGKPSLAVRLQVALLRRSGLGAVQPHPDNREDVAWAVVLDPDGREMGPPVPFTWEDAQRAGLVKGTCRPDSHPQRGNQGCGCKTNWKNYPADMLYWRAAGRAVRFYFPEIGLGVYSPDELGAITDETGDPIDPTTIALPAGYDEPASDRRTRQADEAAKLPADGDELWLLQARILALPDGHQSELRRKWATEGRSTYGYRPAVLLAGALNYAKSLVSGQEAAAKRDGYEPDVAVPAQLDAAFRHLLDVFVGPDPGPGEPTAAPEPPAAPDTPTDPPAATQPAVEADPEADPAAVMAEVAAWLDGIKQDASFALVDQTADAVAAMSWQAVDKALVEEFGDADPVEGGYPIDARRMTLVGYRLMAALEEETL